MSGNCAPVYVRCWSLKTFQLTPSSRLAVREASIKRTSSITCCGASTLTGVHHVGAELLGYAQRLIERDGIGRAAGQHNFAVGGGDTDIRAQKRRGFPTRASRCRRSPRHRRSRPAGGLRHRR